MTTVIQCIVDRGLIHSSIETLCGKVGISKTFFYSFFSSKEELVCHALRYQQPKLLDYARQHGLRPKGTCRHIYLEGPAHHSDANKFITQVAIPIE